MIQIKIISIHAPREGGDPLLRVRHNIIIVFQSTPPARGATKSDVLDDAVTEISIHAPREGGDPDG